jgi:hypothetical protein
MWQPCIFAQWNEFATLCLAVICIKIDLLTTAFVALVISSFFLLLLLLLLWLVLLTTLPYRTIAVLQAVDGIALKMAVDSWAAAPGEEKSIKFRVAEGIRWVEYGTNSIFRILQGTVAAVFGVAIVKSMLLSRWIGGAGVLVGAISIIAGIEVAYRVLDILTL